MPPAGATRNRMRVDSSPQKPPPTPNQRALNVQSVVFGDKLFQPSCSSTYPEDLTSHGVVGRLFVCDRCFKYATEPAHMLAHQRFCEFSASENPFPGRIIYDEKEYQIWEVDGESEPLFTQNLSLFAKLFIESKSVCFDIHGFLYYVLVAKHPKSDPTGNSATQRGKTRSAQPKPQIVGYYSKEKLSWDNHNLACILVFPPWQRLGLGQLLMKVSYEMAWKERRLGGPEKPLSAAGAKSYHTYWSRTLAQVLLSYGGRTQNKSPKKISVKDLCEDTFIAHEDVTSTLQKMGVVGAARKDGCLKVDRDVLRRWCDERGIGHARSTLDGTFYTYPDENISDGEEEEVEEE